MNLCKKTRTSGWRRGRRVLVLGAVMLGALGAAPAWGQDFGGGRDLVVLRVPLLVSYQFPFDAPLDLGSDDFTNEVLNDMRFSAYLQVLIRPLPVMHFGVESGITLGATASEYQELVVNALGAEDPLAVVAFDLPIRAIVGFDLGGFGIDAYGGISFLDFDTFAFDQYTFEIGGRVNLFRFLVFDVGYILPAQTFSDGVDIANVQSQALDFTSNAVRVGIGISVGGGR